MNLSGSVWLNLSKSIWTYLNLSRSIWIYLDYLNWSESIWICLNLSKSVYLNLSDYPSESVYPNLGGWSCCWTLTSWFCDRFRIHSALSIYTCNDIFTTWPQLCVCRRKRLLCPLWISLLSWGRTLTKIPRPPMIPRLASCWILTPWNFVQVVCWHDNELGCQALMRFFGKSNKITIEMNTSRVR